MDYIVNIHVWSLPEKTLDIWKFDFMIFINAELLHANIWRMAPITDSLAAASSHIGDPTEKLLPQFDPLIHGVQRTGGDLRCAELWHHLCGENCRQPMRHECAMRHENMAHHKNWVEVNFFGFPAPSCMKVNYCKIWAPATSAQPRYTWNTTLDIIECINLSE